jgi:hypothetical protein
MALFVSLLCIIVIIWLLLQFAPQTYLEVFVDEASSENGYLKVSVSVQNTSRGRLTKQTVLLQSLAYGGDKALACPDNVPFKTSTVRSGEEPLEWHEPSEVFKGTRHLFPGETLTTERLVPLPEKAALVHVGLQFNAEQGPIEAVVSRFFTLNSSWETAAFYLVDKDS